MCTISNEDGSNQISLIEDYCETTESDQIVKNNSKGMPHFRILIQKLV
jgi:hypothetical protein